MMPALDRVQVSRLILVAGIVLATLSLTSCWKKSGYAVVLEKEHIAAAVPSTPNEQREDTPSPSPAGPAESPGGTEEEPRPLAPNEVAVDQYVMDKGARGTSRDPRALPDEQWLVRVQMVSTGLVIDVHAGGAQFEKLKPGDRVHITYRQGKYTGTIWGSSID
jgi:hypothetical protein